VLLSIKLPRGKLMLYFTNGCFMLY